MHWEASFRVKIIQVVLRNFPEFWQYWDEAIFVCAKFLKPWQMWSHSGLTTTLQLYYNPKLLSMNMLWSMLRLLWQNFVLIFFAIGEMESTIIHCNLNVRTARSYLHCVHQRSPWPPVGQPIIITVTIQRWWHMQRIQSNVIPFRKKERYCGSKLSVKSIVKTILYANWWKTCKLRDWCQSSREVKGMEKWQHPRYTMDYTQSTIP